MTTTGMMMIFDLWNDAVILKLLLQQSVFLLQCFHLTIIIVKIIMIIMIILMTKIKMIKTMMVVTIMMLLGYC